MPGPSGHERRSEPRYDVRIDVDYAAAGTTLFAHITDISSMGIFVATPRPEPVGTRLALRFPAPPEDAAQGPAIEAIGEVVWIADDGAQKGHAGMGIRFRELAPEMRSRLLELVRSVAYLGGSG